MIYLFKKDKMDVLKSISDESLNKIIEGDKDEKYQVIITNLSNALSITIVKENYFPKLEYSKEFNLNELYKISRFFKVFEDIQSIIDALKENFESKKPKIKEEKDCITLKIIPMMLALGESNLVIPKKNMMIKR